MFTEDWIKLNCIEVPDGYVVIKSMAEFLENYGDRTHKLWYTIYHKFRNWNEPIITNLEDEVYTWTEFCDAKSNLEIGAPVYNYVTFVKKIETL
jgi:hypothetical protein